MGEGVSEKVGEMVSGGGGMYVCLHARRDGDGGVSPWPLTPTVLFCVRMTEDGSMPALEQGHGVAQGRARQTIG